MQSNKPKSTLDKISPEQQMMSCFLFSSEPNATQTQTTVEYMYLIADVAATDEAAEKCSR